MGTSRVVFYCLLAFNLACAAVIANGVITGAEPFTGSSEPDRMENQLFPEKLTVLEASTEPPTAVSAPAPAPLAAPASAPVSEASQPAPEASVPAVAVATVAASAPGATTCVAFRSLTADQSQAIQQKARAASKALDVRETTAGPTSFWVHIPPQDGKAGAERRAAELKALGLEDFFIEQAAGENRYAISLGLFHAEGLAQRQLETLQKRGVKGAKISSRASPKNVQVEITGAADLIEGLVRDASAALKGSERDTCKGG